MQLAADGAEVIAPAAGARDFPHRGLGDEDEVDLGGLTLRALATPGHTAEHQCYLLLDGSSTLGVFTGGSLLVGAAARTDPSGAEHTADLARAHDSSLQRLARSPESRASGAEILDVRPYEGYAHAQIPGSLSTRSAGVRHLARLARADCDNAAGDRP